MDELERGEGGQREIFFIGALAKAISAAQQERKLGAVMPAAHIHS